MEILEGIRTRKSIRRYTGKIGSEEIDTLLRAGFAAPSAHNKRPWEFLVIRDEKIIDDICKIHKYARFLKDAGTGILVLGDSDKAFNRDFLIQDCSAALQNILLAAHGMDLGATWCGVYGGGDEIYNGFVDYFRLPANIIPVGLIVVGKKEIREMTERNRYDEDKIHFDRW
ncbi:MAG: nitroreductase family protein [Tissierellia bacterium]|nr:nitroreductase family protein [Tissierellia bacterium]